MSRDHATALRPGDRARLHLNQSINQSIKIMVITKWLGLTEFGKENLSNLKIVRVRVYFEKYFPSSNLKFPLYQSLLHDALLMEKV